MQLPALDQHSSDRSKRAPILVGVSDSHRSAFCQRHAARPLDVKKKCVEGVVDPDQLLARKRCTPGVDVGARPVRHDTLAIDAAAHAPVFELGKKLRQVDSQEVVRSGIQRITIALVATAATLQQRLVIAGHEPGIASVVSAHAVWGKMRSRKMRAPLRHRPAPTAAQRCRRLARGSFQCLARAASDIRRRMPATLRSAHRRSIREGR